MDDLDDEFAPPPRDRSTTFTLAMTAGFFIVLLVLWLLLKDKAEDQADPGTPPVAASPPAGGILQPKGLPAPQAVPIAEEDSGAVDPPPAPVTVDGQPKAEFEILTNCHLAADPGNDGDTFLCRTEAGKQHRFTLYWADAPEVNAPAGPFQEKFGLTDATLVTASKQAADLANKLIGAGSFDLVTAWQRADSDAHYAYIFYADTRGQTQNLAMTLVRQGSALIRPEERSLPDGTSPGQFLDQLQRAQAEAREGKRGAWGLR